MTAVRPWAEVAATLRYDDGISTPTFGDLEVAADLIESLAAESDVAQAEVIAIDDAYIRVQVERDMALAVIAEVQTALDQYDVWPDDAIPSKAATACVSAVAKAVRP